MPSAADARPTRTRTRWPLERVLFALAGTMTLLSVLLVTTVSPWFLLLTAFVGLNQWLYVTIGNCPASLLLRRFGMATPAKADGAPFRGGLRVGSPQPIGSNEI